MLITSVAFVPPKPKEFDSTLSISTFSRRVVTISDGSRPGSSVVTLAELRYGIERMPAGNRRKRLDEWLRNELPLRFEGRTLSVDSTIADVWGKVVARREAVGRPIATADAFIAATVVVHGLTLVTRNASDFEPTVKAIVSPWTTG